jgi:hypothetical protein
MVGYESTKPAMYALGEFKPALPWIKTKGPFGQVRAWFGSACGLSGPIGLWMLHEPSCRGPPGGKGDRACGAAL